MDVSTEDHQPAFQHIMPATDPFSMDARAPVPNPFLWSHRPQEVQREQETQPMQQVSVKSAEMRLHFQAAAQRAHLAMLQQQRERDFCLAMANSHCPWAPPRQQNVFLGGNTYNDPSAMANDNLLFRPPGPGPTSPLRSGGGRRQSQSAQAIRRARDGQTTVANIMPMPQVQDRASNNPIFPSQCRLLPSGPSDMTPSLPTQQNSLRPSSSSPSNQSVNVDASGDLSGVPSIINIRQKEDKPTGSNFDENEQPVASRATGRTQQLQAPTRSSTDTNGGRSTTSTAKPLLAGRDHRALQAVAAASGKEAFPEPDVDSWMHNLDEIHPSPVIQVTEGSPPARVKAVAPDTKTKLIPIAEEDITRYDILSGRGGKTNSHEVSANTLH